MTAAMVEPSAEVNDGKVKIADMDPALKATIRRWHDQTYKTRVMLEAPAIILTGVIQDEVPDVARTISPALEVVEHCVAMLSSLAEEIDSAVRGRVLIEAEQPAGKSDSASTPAADLEADFDERVFVIHKGRVVVASGILEEQIKRELARVTEPAAA